MSIHHSQIGSQSKPKLYSKSYTNFVVPSWSENIFYILRECHDSKKKIMKLHNKIILQKVTPIAHNHY
jgi:hypothetical protein